MTHKLEQGFSLIELLLVVALLGILGTIGVGNYRNYVKNVEVTNVGKVMITDLQSMRAKSMAGEDGLKWGVRFVNTTDVSGNPDYYELFSTPTTYADAGLLIKQTTYLPGTVAFSAPSSGVNTDVIFNKITGSTSDATMTIGSESLSKTITVNTLGNVY